MAIHSLHDLLRRSVKRNGMGPEITASQIIRCANDFLSDILPVQRRSDARAVSLRSGTLKLYTKSSSVNQYLRPFEEELKDRIAEKFREQKVSKIFYQINRDSFQ